MPSLGDVFGEFNDRQNEQRNRSNGKFKVATTAPFEVYLDGIETDVDGNDLAVPGLKLDGLSYSVGTTGVYLLFQGQLPICLPTLA